MGWGMEDPAATARRKLGLGTEIEWGESPRRRAGRDGLLVVLFIALAAGAVWWALQRADSAAADDPATRIARGEITGITDDSLARPDNLAAVLKEFESVAAPRGRVRSLRVSPAWVQATMVTPDGEEYFLDRRVGDDVERRTFAPTSSKSTTRLSDIDPADVKRAVTTVARRAGVPPTALAYVTLGWPGPRSRQTIYLQIAAPAARDRNWVGTGNGSVMRRAGEPAAAVPGGADAAFDEPQRLLRCVQDAAGDVTRIQECVR